METTKQALQEARSLIETGQGDVTYALAMSTDEDTFTPALEALYTAIGSPTVGSKPWDKVNVLIEWNDERGAKDWVGLYDLAIERTEA